MSVDRLLAIIFGLATVFSIVLFVAFLKRQRPVWAVRTTKIIGRDTNAPSELKVTFDDKPVENVYRTEILFFNRGNGRINRDDIAESITIHFGNAEILRPPIVKPRPNRDSVAFSAKQMIGDGGSAVQLDFSWLGTHDGAIVEVMHTKAETITQTGQFKDIHLGKLKEIVVISTRNFWVDIVLPSIYFVLIALVLPASLIQNILTDGKPISRSDVSSAVVVLIFVFVALFFVWRKISSYLSTPSWVRKLIEPTKGTKNREKT